MKKIAYILFINVLIWNQSMSQSPACYVGEKGSLLQYNTNYIIFSGSHTTFYVDYGEYTKKRGKLILSPYKMIDYGYDINVFNDTLFVKIPFNYATGDNIEKIFSEGYIDLYKNGIREKSSELTEYFQDEMQGSFDSIKVALRKNNIFPGYPNTNYSYTIKIFENQFKYKYLHVSTKPFLKSYLLYRHDYNIGYIRVPNKNTIHVVQKDTRKALKFKKIEYCKCFTNLEYKKLKELLIELNFELCKR